MAYQPEIEKLERQYQDEPAKLFAQLADAYRRRGRVGEALDILRMHLDDRPNYVSALIVLGRCQLDQQNDDEAVAAFERVLAIDAENIIALKLLAQIAARRGDEGGARGWLQRLLEVDPMNDETEALLAALDAPAPVAEPVAQPMEPPAAALPSPERAGVIESDDVIERASAEYLEPSAEAAADGPRDFELEPRTEFAPPAAAESGDPERPLVRATVEETEPVSAAAGPGIPPDDDATEELQPFDAELSWGVGERQSREISETDLARARAASEEELGVPAQSLPGLEHAEVPETAQIPDDVPPTEGLLPQESAEAAQETPQAQGLTRGGVTPPLWGDTADTSGSRSFEGTPPELGPDLSAQADETLEIATDELGEVEEELSDEPFLPESAVGLQQSLVERGSLTGLPVFLPDEEETAPAAATPALDDSDPEPVVTETMAELYARQGLYDDARSVYRRLLEASPHDARLRERLDELDRQGERISSPGTRGGNDPRARYSAVATGGISAREFLRAILAGRSTREPARVAVPEPPTPLEEAFAEGPVEPRGQPTRPASDAPSLASVFGEEPRSSDAVASATRAGSRRTGVRSSGFSFDEFFGEPRTEDTADERRSGDRTPRLSAEEIDDSDESFKAWLKGLKS